MHWLLNAFILFVLPFSAWALNPDECNRVQEGRPLLLPWNQKIDFAETEAVLHQSPVKQIVPMKEFLKAHGRAWTGQSEVYWIELEDGVQGVYKPNPEATALGWDASAEIGMYRLSNFLGARLVPPTIERKVDARFGSVQYYVDTPIDFGDNPELYRQRFEAMSSRHQSNTHLLHFVAGQWDNHPGNLLIDATGTPALIDNEVILMLQMVRYGEFPFSNGQKPTGERGPLHPKEFPFESARKLVNPSYEELSQAFLPYVTEAQLKRIFKKIPYAADRTLSYVHWSSALWVQMKRHRKVAHTSVYSRATLDGLRALDRKVLKQEVLPARFTDDHIYLMLDRAQQVLRASETGELIP